MHWVNRRVLKWSQSEAVQRLRGMFSRSKFLDSADMVHMGTWPRKGFSGWPSLKEAEHPSAAGQEKELPMAPSLSISPSWLAATGPKWAQSAQPPAAARDSRAPAYMCL